MCKHRTRSVTPFCLIPYKLLSPFHVFGQGNSLSGCLWLHLMLVTMQPLFLKKYFSSIVTTTEPGSSSPYSWNPQNPPTTLVGSSIFLSYFPSVEGSQEGLKEPRESTKRKIQGETKGSNKLLPSRETGSLRLHPSFTILAVWFAVLSFRFFTFQINNNNWSIICDVSGIV